MFLVKKIDHPDYGIVIAIDREEPGNCRTPFEAYQKTKSVFDSSSIQDKIQIRALLDCQLLSLQEINQWQIDEYKILPKCQECFSLLSGDVFVHPLCGHNLFCSQFCTDKNYAQELEKLNDLEDIEYL